MASTRTKPSRRNSCGCRSMCANISGELVTEFRLPGPDSTRCRKGTNPDERNQDPRPSLERDPLLQEDRRENDRDRARPGRGDDRELRMLGCRRREEKDERSNVEPAHEHEYSEHGKSEVAASSPNEHEWDDRHASGKPGEPHGMDF